MAEAREHRLLIINSYNEAAPWSQELITPIALLTARTDGVRADIIHMNGTFIRNESMYRQVENGIFQRFEDQPRLSGTDRQHVLYSKGRIVKEWGDIPMVLISKTKVCGPQNFYITGRNIRCIGQYVKPLIDLQGKYNFTMIEVPDLYRRRSI